MRLASFVAALALLAAGCSGPSAEEGGAGPAYRDAGNGDDEAGEAGQEPAAPAQADLDEGTGTIRGVVVDETVTPIQGATVVVAATDLPALQTDVDGTFRIDGAAPGAYFLQVTKDGFMEAQVQINVANDEPEPPVVRIMLERIPGTQPYIQQDLMQLRIECATGTLGIGFNACGAVPIALEVVCNGGSGVPPTGVCLPSPVQDVNVYLEFEPLATFIQSELSWEPSTALGDRTALNIFSYPKDDRAPTARTQFVGTHGLSPLLAVPINQTTVEEHRLGSVNGISYNIIADGRGETANVVIQQDYELFTTMFYNFQPAMGWTFVRDGLPDPP